MGDLPPETTPDDDADAPEVRAMRLLETECAPMVGPRHRKRAPYWRPTPPPMVHVVTIPTREWYRADYPEVTARHTVLHMDVNSAYVSAASSALFAHGPLVHTGPLPFNNKPGYWLVETATHWNRPDLPNPLGTGRLRERMWLATPTVKLLDDLTAAGAWPGFEVVDSWTAEVSCRLNSWTDKLRDMRAAAIDAGDTAAEAEIKKGYVFAFQMMLTGTKSKTHRPDWNHTVRAQMLARTDRKSVV